MGLLDDRGNLAGRKAVIIGGADGIGRAVTLALAGARIDIAFCDINAAAVQSTSAEVAAMGRRVLGETADAVVSDQLQRFYAAAERFLGSADIVVNVVGGVLMQPFMDKSAESCAQDVHHELLQGDGLGAGAAGNSR